MVPDQHTATGTALFIILPVTILSVLYFWKHKQIDFKLAWWIMGFYVVGSGIGTFGSGKFSDKQIKLYIAILFFILGIISLVTYTKIKGVTGQNPILVQACRSQPLYRKNKMNLRSCY
jgi:uncharacterized membrane protein YfcA